MGNEVDKVVGGQFGRSLFTLLQCLNHWCSEYTKDECGEKKGWWGWFHRKEKRWEHNNLCLEYGEDHLQLCFGSVSAIITCILGTVKNSRWRKAEPWLLSYAASSLWAMEKSWKELPQEQGFHLPAPSWQWSPKAFITGKKVPALILACL